MNLLRKSNRFKSVIGVSTHRSGIPFLQNLLTSLDSYDVYPIVVVINDFKDEDWRRFEKVLTQFSRLPIHVATVRENLGEFGVLAAMDSVAHCDNILLLSHSCEVKDPALFELVLERAPYESSVALSYLPHYPQYRAWTSFLGKYRRDVLRAIDFARYAPKSLFEFHLAEVCLTHSYGIADPHVQQLFPDFVDCGVFEEKFGRKVMKIENRYLIKWKSHWNFGLIFETMKRQGAAIPSADAVAAYLERIPDGHRYSQLRQLMSRFLKGKPTISRTKRLFARILGSLY